VLFTGGGLSLALTTPYMRTAAAIFAYAVERAAAGEWWPLHGTCQGMQALSVLAAWNESVLTTNAFDSENVSWPLDFTAEGLADSRVFGTAPAFIVDIFRYQNVTPNLHHDGVTPAAWFATNLTAFYTLVSTNVDRRGRAFVSTIEARNAPITGFQWHPGACEAVQDAAEPAHLRLCVRACAGAGGRECVRATMRRAPLPPWSPAERAQFDWSLGYGFNHAYDAVLAMQYVANFVVDSARRNAHAFANSTLETAVSMYSWPPLTYDDVLDGDQVYVFPPFG